ncbi:CARDB domain-containing protein [Halovivax limisalsi]|uniref:CARDB domain-containing protein n=1 Tax=Halovivax limisalsi TaxID=1453760 RepID=UPI001FFCE3E0|nr:CARDB domain-containing protein [Halovivax limisalsi]
MTGFVGVGLADVDLGQSTAQEDVASSTTGPIETFEVVDESYTGYYGYAQFSIDWTVDAESGDTVQVTVTNLDTDSVVAEYSGASGSESPVEYYTDGDQYEIELTVTGDGPTQCQRYVGPADGTDNLEFEDCSEGGQPAIEQTGVTLTEQAVTVGEVVTVAADYANTGTAEGTTTAELLVDGTVVDSQQLTLAPEENTTVSFDRTFDAEGEYTVAVDGTTAGTVTVAPPADGPAIDTLSVTDDSEEAGFIRNAETNLTVEWAVQGSSITDTTVTVENLRTGDSAEFSGQSGVDQYIKEFRFDNPMAVTVEATTADGTTLCEQALGYSDGTADFTNRDCVENGQPNVQLADLRASDTEITVGDAVEVTAEYTNTGDAYDNATVEFTGDGLDEPVTKEVAVLPNRTRTASIERTYESAGTQNITVDGQTVSIDVTRPDEADISVVNASLPDGQSGYMVGEQIEVQATVENIGSAAGTKELVLTEEDSDQPLDNATVTVDAGAKRAVTLATTYDEPQVNWTSLRVNGVLAGSFNVLGSEVSITEAYDLLPSEPETVEMTVAYDLGAAGDFEAILSELDSSSVTITDTTGLSVDGETVTADAATEQASVTIQKQIDLNKDSRGITADWAFFDDLNHDERSHVLAVRNRTATTDVTVGGGYVYLGPHERVSETTTKQTITLVVADHADIEEPPQQLLEALTTMSEDFEVGTTMNVTGFGVPGDVNGPGGLAGSNRFWFKSDPSTMIHEYVHTRQSASVKNWEKEAIAEFYEGKATFRYGGKSYDDARAHNPGNPVDLVNGEWSGIGGPDYTHGSDVINAIDSRVIEATDGQRSFEDVFARLNDGENLTAAYEAVTGESLDNFYATYVEGENRPAYDNNPEKYDFTQTETVSGTLPQVAVDSGVVFTSSVWEPFVQFNASNLHPETGLIDSDPIFGVHSYTYPNATTWSTDVVTGVQNSIFDRKTGWNNYSVGFLQEASGGESFPRDGIPDLHALGTAEAPGQLPTDAEPVTIDVVDENGQPVANRTLAVTVKPALDTDNQRFEVEDQTTTDGEFVPGSQPGLELSGSYQIRYRNTTDSSYRFYNFDTSANGSESVRIVDGGVEQPMESSVGQSTIRLFGTIVPNASVAPGDEVTVEALYTDADESGSIPVYVDGQQVDTIDVQGPVSSGTTAAVTLTLDNPGERSIRVGDGPAQTVTVEGDVGDAPSIETFEVTDESTTGTYGYAEFGIDWAVADAQSATVTVTNLDTGSIMAEFSATSGSESPYEYYADGDEYEIELTATAADGSQVCERFVGPADGSTATLQRQACSSSTAGLALTGPATLRGPA